MQLHTPCLFVGLQQLHTSASACTGCTPQSPALQTRAVLNPHKKHSCIWACQWAHVPIVLLLLLMLLHVQEDAAAGLEQQLLGVCGMRVHLSTLLLYPPMFTSCEWFCANRSTCCVQIAPAELAWSVDLDALADAAVNLVRHGWPPSMLLVYDEVRPTVCWEGLPSTPT
jgi:hypothetical protein